MTKKREPRPPLALPAVSFNDAQDADITEHVEHWYELIAAVLGSEAGQLAVQGDIYRQLKAGDTATLPLDYIVAMADARHPPADHACGLLSTTISMPTASPTCRCSSGPMRSAR